MQVVCQDLFKFVNFLMVNLRFLGSLSVENRNNYPEWKFMFNKSRPN